jgi:hypothetical protein
VFGWNFRQNVEYWVMKGINKFIACSFKSKMLWSVLEMCLYMSKVSNINRNGWIVKWFSSDSGFETQLKKILKLHFLGIIYTMNEVNVMLKSEMFAEKSTGYQNAPGVLPNLL